ncbi:MAG: hypothetical protein GF307_02525 [candidate division Zixibacteria bacterium]|nr:hypothetical protein [candidate division Zixibacteria bacterium]
MRNKNHQKIFQGKIVFILMIFIFLAGSFLTGQRLWGINYLAYYDVPVRLILGAIAVILCLLNLPESFISKSSPVSTPAKWIAGLLAGISAAIVFYYFRSSTLLTGDGQLWMNSYLLDTLFLPYRFDHNYLSRFIYEQGGRGIAGLFDVGPFQAMAWVSIISGGLFIAFLVRFVANHFSAFGGQLFAGLVIIGTNATMLFFGYIESYTPVYLAVSLYILFSLDYIFLRKSIIFPAIFLLLAIGTHLQAVCLLPSFITMLIARYRQPLLLSGRIKRFFIFAPALTAVLACTAVSLFWSNDFLLRIIPSGASNYVLFSLKHTIDIVNELMVLAPVAITLLIIFALSNSRLSNRDISSTAVLFIANALIYPLIFLVFIDPKLGMAWDWDLFSFVAVPLTVLPVVIYKIYKPSPFKLNSLILPICGLLLVSVIPAAGVLNNTEKSASRFEDIIDFCPDTKAYAYEVLAKHHEDRRELEEALDAYREASEHSPDNPRYLGSIGFIYSQMNMYREAYIAYRAAVEINPDSRSSLYNLSLITATMGKLEESRRWLNRLIKLYPTDIESVTLLAFVQENLGNYREMLVAAEHAHSLDPENGTALYYLGKANYYNGMKEMGLDYVREALKHLPVNSREAREVRRFLANPEISDK